jgi:hypothetical protein
MISPLRVLMGRHARVDAGASSPEALGNVKARVAGRSDDGMAGFERTVVALVGIALGEL